MNVSMRQLRLFEATVRLGRLTLAADEQAISQSAASQAIKEMERQLGYPVLERRGRELILNEAGRRILPKVRQILSLSDCLVHANESEVVGTLKLAASVTIACYLLPERIAGFGRRYPDATAVMDIFNTEGVLQLIEKGRAQLGFIEGPALHPELDIVPWRFDELAVFCAPDHPLAAVGAVSVEQLADQQWVVREQGSGTRAVLETALQAREIKPKVALALTRQEAIKQSVRAGLGIGCLSALSIADDVDTGRLVRLDIPFDLGRQMSWVCSPESRSHALVRAFLQLDRND